MNVFNIYYLVYLYVPIFSSDLKLYLYNPSGVNSFDTIQNLLATNIRTKCKPYNISECNYDTS